MICQGQTGALKRETQTEIEVQRLNVTEMTCDDSSCF